MNIRENNGRLINYLNICPNPFLKGAFLIISRIIAKPFGHSILTQERIELINV